MQLTSTELSFPELFQDSNVKIIFSNVNVLTGLPETITLLVDLISGAWLLEDYAVSMYSAFASQLFSADVKLLMMVS